MRQTENRSLESLRVLHEELNAVFSPENSARRSAESVGRHHLRALRTSPADAIGEKVFFQPNKWGLLRPRPRGGEKFLRTYIETARYAA